MSSQNSRMFATKECVGTSRNFSQNQLDEITRQVELDAASLIFALIVKGFDLDPLHQPYDEEDKKYRNEYREEEIPVDY